MREFLVFLDEPAAAAIEAVAAFLSANGLAILHRSPLSVSFSGAPGDHAGNAPPVSDQPQDVTRADPETARLARPGGELLVGHHSAGTGTLPLGAGQVAAVPVQRRPEWCRVWLTVNDAAAVAQVVDAYITLQRERSRRVETAVQELERDIYGEAQWPAYEATLRASLQKQGAPGAAIEAKIAAFKRRWLALGRKAAAAAPEDLPPSA
jgi:hypothetical protein